MSDCSIPTTSNKIFNIGINTIWYNDFVNAANDTYKYITCTIDRLINVYKNHIIGKINNDYNIFSYSLFCGCDNENSFDELFFRSYNIDLICHKYILISIVSSIKHIIAKLNHKKSNKSKINPKTIRECIMNRIILGRSSDDIFLAFGDKINDKYIIDKKISDGSSGCILLAIDILTKVNVILKISCANNNSINQLKKEYETLITLNSAKNTDPEFKNDDDVMIPRVIDIIDIKSNLWCKSDYHKALILERYGPNLDDYIFEHLHFGAQLKICIDSYNLQKIIRQLVKTIKLIHKCNLIHKDIKCSNILLRKPNSNNQSDNYDIILIDYGISLDFDKNDENEFIHLCGTMSYMTPEELVGPYYGKPVDVFCIGLVIVELIRGDCVFDDDVVKTINAYKKIYNITPTTYNQSIVTNEQFLEAMTIKNAFKNFHGVRVNVSNCDKNLNCYNKDYFTKDIIDTDLKDLINSCLEFNPKERITIDDLTNHEYIVKKINKSLFDLD